MSTKKIVLFYLVYLLFQFFGFFFFFKGFFKVKHDCKKKSTSFNHFLNKTKWFEPTFNKSILMIIDGLRYDFAFTNNSNQNFEQTPFYINQMPIISTLINEKSDQTLFFQAFSDPPTVTTQRITALTSGNLPSFMEFTDNFDGKKV